ncbi:MAG: hypothetical protein JSS04_09405 [Proteobacteria bacterium]|nr:hypothetical protein [Pseudomonadota bacterium]
MRLVATMGALIVFGLLVTTVTGSFLEQVAKRQVERATAPEVAVHSVPR